MELLRDVLLALDEPNQVVHIVAQLLEINTAVRFLIDGWEVLEEIGLNVSNIEHVLDKVGRELNVV